jgi:HEAT repeat protein
MFSAPHLIWPATTLTHSHLRKFGDQAKSAIPALQKAIEDSDAHVRQQAAVALKRISSESSAN